MLIILSSPVRNEISKRGKTEILLRWLITGFTECSEADLEVRKKKKYKKLASWLLVDLAVASIIFSLLLYKPTGYGPLAVNAASRRRGRVHPYLTRLLSELYNGAQRGQPFELVVIEEQINEAIGRSQWPKESEGIMFSTPEVLFRPESVVLMGTANIKGAEFVVTIVLQPRVDQQGLLNLQVAKVKIGAMNITPLAKVVARRMYQHRLATVPVDIDDLRTKIAGSLLSDEPFEPVFHIEDKKVRVEKITVTQGKLILHLVPA
ncbi:MAG: hypothetical protein ACE5NM_01930 [Sedimentisphaerales bacterium]